MVRLLRHRQTKGPVSARPYLNRRATPRLHLKCPAQGHDECNRDFATITPESRQGPAPDSYSGRGRRNPTGRLGRPCTNYLPRHKSQYRYFGNDWKVEPKIHEEGKEGTEQKNRIFRNRVEGPIAERLLV